MDQPRYIERAERVIVLPSNPAEWTDDQIDQAVAQLNAEGLKRVLLAAIRVADEKRQEREGAA
jgi:hypothetical protein